jgi:hypothetical protein
MKTFYFTNQLADRHEAQVIEVLIEKSTGIRLDNPFYGDDGKPTVEIAQLDAGQPVTVENSTIVRMDLKKIIDSDGIIAYLTRYSFGSPCEIALAHEMWGKPVYIIVPEHSQVSADHPWVQELSTKVFRSVEEFVMFAKNNLVEKEAAA